MRVNCKLSQFLLVRRLTEQHLVSQNPHTPGIDLLVVRCVGKLLRTDVGIAAHHCTPEGVAEHRAAKIAYLQVRVIEQQVLGLDIPVQDILPVHKQQPLAHLLDEVGGLTLADLLLAIAGHTAIGHALHDQVDFVLVVENPVHACDMLMDQEGLDLDLAKYVLFES